MLGPALRRAAMHQRPPRPFAVRATRTFTQKPPNNNSHAVSGSSEASEPPAPSKAAEPVKTTITTPKVEEPKTNTTNTKSSTTKITALTVPVWRRLGPVTRFIDGYSRSQSKRPYWTQVVSALVIFFAADLSAQNISGAEYDPLRTARSLIIGAAAAIPQFKWFIFLSKNFNYKSKPLSLLAKVLFNQVTFAVAFPAYFFTGQALLAASKRSRSGSQLAAECKREDAELTYAVHEAQGTSLVGNEQLPFENRILRALAISPAGKPISNFSSVPELIGGLRDAIKVHRSLLLDGKILHRDISENNIIITDPEDADGFRGMLIDLDLAKEDGKGPSGARHRTGTMEFMAIEVLLGISHTYRHDLEAFYYVLLWLCVRRGWSLSRSPKRQPRGNPLSHWYTGTYEDIARNKRGDMDKNGLEDVLLLFPPMLGCVKALCRTIRDVLFPYKQGLFTGTPCDSELLYGPIINAFDDSLKEIQEMEETTEEN